MGTKKSDLINNENVTNPYLLAYFERFGIGIGGKCKTTDYMFWIDQKHDEFRKLHRLPEHITLNKEEEKEFCNFLKSKS